MKRDLSRYHFFSKLPPMPRWAIAALLIPAAWFVVTHYLHAFSEVINWDEFAMLDRADRTLRFGKVVSDGRPGLVTIILMPFVKGCIDSTRSVVEARILWQAITILYLLGVYFLVRRWFVHAGRAEEGRAQGLLAVALLAFLPAFVVWSVQVRSDQAALAAATWGGLLLLSTSYRSAIAAGVLFAIGLLCTQKAIYAIALVGLLFATATSARAWNDSSWSRRELTLAAKRCAIAGTAMLVAIGAYFVLVPEATQLANQRLITSAVGIMQYSRAGQGYRIYTVHAPRLLVHWLLFATLAVWTWRCISRRDQAEVPLLGTCWLSLLLGVVVIMIHGSAFPYFIMTAGLFPAVALSMAAGKPLAMAGRSAWPIVVGLVFLSAMQSGRESVEMLADTQREQRETLRLVYASPLRDRRGFHNEGALLCMRDPDPLPVLFSPGIWKRFYDSPQALVNRVQFVEEFRRRPIAYIVESYRLGQFPPEIRSFWAQHYIWYAHSLYIAGYNLAGEVGPRDIDVIVAGRYRWDPDVSSPDASLRLGQFLLAPGQIINLQAAVYRAEVSDGQARGQLILADLPRPTRTGYPFFYLHRQLDQLGGFR